MEHTHETQRNHSRSNASFDQNQYEDKIEVASQKPPALSFASPSQQQPVQAKTQQLKQEDKEDEELENNAPMTTEYISESLPPNPIQRKTGATSGVVQRNGNSPERENGTPIQIPNPRDFTFAEQALWYGIRAGTMMLPGIGPILGVIMDAPSMAAATGCTIGIGIAGSAGAGAGIGLGTGLYFAPNGDIGVYGSGAFDNGFLFSAAIGYQVTMVKGGVDKFGGTCYAFAISGGEVVVGGLNVLFTTDLEFLGISGMVGVGVGLPFEFYFEAQHTWTSDPVANVEP